MNTMQLDVARVSHVAHINESWRTHVNESCHTYEHRWDGYSACHAVPCDVLFFWPSRLSSCSSLFESVAVCCSVLQGTSHVIDKNMWMSHVMCCNVCETSYAQLCHSYEWVMPTVVSLMWESHVMCPFVWLGWWQHSYVWHDALICVPWLIHLCDSTHSYVWHKLVMCVRLVFYSS